MTRRDQPSAPGTTPEQGRPSLDETIRRATQVIETSRAEIARSQALSVSEADLSRALESLSVEHGRLTAGQKRGA
jgi:hypothetical protein